MIDTDIIKCLIEDLLDRICLINSSSPIINSPLYYSSKSIENKFQQSINILNKSIKQLLTYELNTVVNNGQLTTTSNIRHSRYYNPATTIKQTNDLKKRLQWIEQRQMIMKQLNINQEKTFSQSNSDLNSLENIWFDHRLKILDNSLELLLKKTEEQENNNNDDSSCARCRVYQRKKENDSQLLKKIKHIHQIQNEHNYSTTCLHYPSSESEHILSLSKIADRIGHNSNLNVSNHTKKNLSTSTIKKKQQSKLQSSISLIVPDSNKTNKRTLEESRNISNSNFISTNYDLTNKRQKRIASPQSSLSVSSTNTPVSTTSSSFPHDILTPGWRVLTNTDFEISLNQEKSSDQQEIEDVSDESCGHRHMRCELEQESWLTNSSTSNNISLTSNRKSGTLQTSLSVPNSLSTTNQKQYRYRLTPNGVAYTETIDTK
ncbi:unnamed protein product [Adineta steineri]|uniref:Uncharacterized protein n=1 Tax=Adineta steineri TaxID=433720 RepID=A0A818I989_9BILA|nr:unnamed protein product [Adineta steineri]CAF0922755.1 unnamed protein product [Adineta steineri]CAF3499450.1 unnamed protein product [Adineta steineri]CAF3501757.1 unnamed protein product [Adineta steineri]CAF3517085.1 unnamed protein product [Adineta steineri]